MLIRLSALHHSPLPTPHSRLLISLACELACELAAEVIEVEEEVEVEVGEDGDWADGDEKAGGAVAGADRTPGKSPAIGAGSNRPGTVIASSASSIVRRNTPSASPAIGASPMRAGSATPGSIRGADEGMEPGGGNQRFIHRVSCSV